MLPFFYFSYFVFGILPSFLWLLFYLKRDVHPEDNKKIMEIFFLGMMMIIPAGLIEYLLSLKFEIWEERGVLFLFLYSFLGVALIEEIFKYLPVRLRVIKSSHFDEPVDAMLYPIISALGFAALENIVAIFGRPFEEMAMINFLRSISAIFIHTLSSATLGYFLTLSLNKKFFKNGLLIFGIALASFFHAMYNILIKNLENGEMVFFFALILYIGFLAILVSFLFSKVKKMKSICKI